MRTPMILASCTLIGACGLALLQLRPSTSGVARASPPAAATIPVEAPKAPAQATPIAVAPPPPAVDGRAQVQRAIEERAPSLRTESEVRAYLDEVEARARRDHQLTAVEVEPAFAAIRALSSGIGPQRASEMEIELARKLNRLAATLASR